MRVLDMRESPWSREAIHEFRAVSQIGNSADYFDFCSMRWFAECKAPYEVRRDLLATSGFSTKEFCEFIGI